MFSKTKAYRLCDPHLRDKIFGDFDDGGGIYKIYSKEGNAVRPVNRVLGTDINGVLYTGKASCFVNRVIDLKKTLDSNYSGNHICGRRYDKIVNFKQRFPYFNLYILLIESEEPDVLERAEIDKYVQKFGEVPPLNAY